MTPAGEFRHRVTLKKPVTTQDKVTGKTTTTWEIVEQHLPAKIVAMSAREFVAAGAKNAEVTGRITIRYYPGVTAAMRLDDDDTGSIYGIVGVIPDPKSGRRELTLAVKEGPGNGR